MLIKKIGTKVRPIAMLVLTAALAGCGVGVGYQSVEKFSLNDPDIYLDNIDQRVRKSIEENPNLHYTQESVIKLWGAPLERISEQNGVERWRYTSKYKKHQGPIIGLLAPIPLTIPMGPIETTLTFEGKALKKAESERELFFFCGYFVSDESARWMCK